jgi:hypothetical protein
MEFSLFSTYWSYPCLSFYFFQINERAVISYFSMNHSKYGQFKRLKTLETDKEVEIQLFFTIRFLWDFIGDTIVFRIRAFNKQIYSYKK